MENPLICPVCHGGAVAEVEDRTLEIYQCPSCHHVFSRLDERQQDQYEEKYFNKTHKRWFSHPDTSLFKLVYQSARRFLPNEKLRLLDVGCGNGSLLQFIAKTDPACELSGIDLIPNQDARIRYYQGDFFTTEIISTFNVVSGLAVIEHVNNPREFVRRAGGLLEKNGLLILMTVNSNGLLYRMARWLRQVGIRKPYDRLFSRHHLQHYTKESLHKLVKLEGFEVLSTKIHNFPFAAIDVPAANRVTEFALRLAVLGIFQLSNLFNQGMLQTIVCRKIGDSTVGS